MDLYGIRGATAGARPRSSRLAAAALHRGGRQRPRRRALDPQLCARGGRRQARDLLHLRGRERGGDPRARRGRRPAGARRGDQGGRHGDRAARPAAGRRRPRSARRDSGAGTSALPSSASATIRAVAGPAEMPQGPWPAAAQSPSWSGSSPTSGRPSNDCGRGHARAPTTFARRRPGTKRSPPRRSVGAQAAGSGASGRNVEPTETWPSAGHQAEDRSRGRRRPRPPRPPPRARAWAARPSPPPPPLPTPARSAARRAWGRSPRASTGPPPPARRRPGAARRRRARRGRASPITHGQAVSPSWKRAPAA